MNKEIEIALPNSRKVVSPDSLFIIAEVGNQFGGDYDKAAALCRAAAEAGADAVKFIFWFPDEIMADKCQMYTYTTSDGTGQYTVQTETMFDMLDRLRLTLDQWVELKQLCDRLGIVFMATVNSPGGMEYAEQTAMSAIKLSSWDWNYTGLWEWAATTGFPVFADLGPVTPEELNRNVGYFKREKTDLILLHCFHSKILTEFNMRTIPYLAQTLDCPVGYSSPDNHDDLDLISVALGGCALEKRLTLDRKGGVLHDSVSKEPKEFANYVNRMRTMKTTLGKEGLFITPEDLRQRALWFRRLVADVDIQQGDTMLSGMIEAKRGETGVSPEFIDRYLGKVATRDIKRNEDIRPDD